MLYYDGNTRGNHPPLRAPIVNPEPGTATEVVELEVAAHAELIGGWRRFYGGLLDRDREALDEAIADHKAKVAAVAVSANRNPKDDGAFDHGDEPKL